MSFAQFDPQDAKTSSDNKKPNTSVLGTVQRTSASFADTATVNVLSNINLGFSLAAALAWNEAVKFILEKHVTIRRARYYHIVYASVLTLLAAGITVLISWIRPGMKSKENQPLIAGMVR